MENLPSSHQQYQEQQQHEHEHEHEHPLSLKQCLQKSIEKLLHHKVLHRRCSRRRKISNEDHDDDDDDDDDEQPSRSMPLSAHIATAAVTAEQHDTHCSQFFSTTAPALALPRKPEIYSAIQRALDIQQLRCDSQEKFWSDVSHYLKVDLDRIRIVSDGSTHDCCDHDSSSCRTNHDDDVSGSNTSAAAPGAAPKNASHKQAIQELTVLQFKQRYLYTNTPCIIQNLSIPITEKWIMGTTSNTTGEIAKNLINTEWFLDNVGSDTLVPIRINQEGYHGGRAAECLTSKMSMKSWIEERTNHPNPRHYLKDWHMQSLFQDLYSDPIIFDDVLNPFLMDNDGGDYRFVYWGCKGSKTGIHSDVLNSFSWSFNVIGTKRWTFYHTDDTNGSGEGALVVDQHRGEMMFVPSGWRHSVVNLEEAISVNHNWMMVGSLDFVFDCLLDEIKAIEEEMDAWGMTTVTSGMEKELSRVREDMLRGCVGMDISMFCVLVIQSFTNCLINLMSICKSENGSLEVSSSDDEWECWFNFTRIVKIMGLILHTSVYDERDSDTEDISENEEDKVIIDMKGRLCSTLGHLCAEETIDLMNSLYAIGCHLTTTVATTLHETHCC